MKAANKLTLLPFALATSAALLVGASGCSDRNRDLVEASGLVIDGYLQSATVCVDIDGDKQCSDNEPNDTTGANAAFALGTFQYAPLVVRITPGVTTESQTLGEIGPVVTEEFFLTAPLNSATVTPLTTLAQVGVEQGYYADFASGASAVMTALNIPADMDLQSYDYIGAGHAQVAVAAEIVSSAIASAVTNMRANVTGSAATTANIYKTAVKVLIDPSLAGKASSSTSLMQEIGLAVKATVANGATVSDIDVAVVVADIKATIAADASIKDASEVLPSELQTAVEQTDEGQTGGATGATGASS
jgi:hypothetical protein